MKVGYIRRSFYQPTLELMKTEDQYQSYDDKKMLQKIKHTFNSSSVVNQISPECHIIHKKQQSEICSSSREEPNRCEKSTVEFAFDINKNKVPYQYSKSNGKINDKKNAKTVAAVVVLGENEDKLPSSPDRLHIIYSTEESLTQPIPVTPFASDIKLTRQDVIRLEDYESNIIPLERRIQSPTAYRYQNRTVPSTNIFHSSPPYRNVLTPISTCMADCMMQKSPFLNSMVALDGKLESFRKEACMLDEKIESMRRKCLDVSIDESIDTEVLFDNVVSLAKPNLHETDIQHDEHYHWQNVEDTRSIPVNIPHSYNQLSRMREIDAIFNKRLNDDAAKVECDDNDPKNETSLHLITPLSKLRTYPSQLRNDLITKSYKAKYNADFETARSSASCDYTHYERSDCNNNSCFLNRRDDTFNCRSEQKLYSSEGRKDLFSSNITASISIRKPSSYSDETLLSGFNSSTETPVKRDTVRSVKCANKPEIYMNLVENEHTSLLRTKRYQFPDCQQYQKFVTHPPKCRKNSWFRIHSHPNHVCSPIKPKKLYDLNKDTLYLNPFECVSDSTSLTYLSTPKNAIEGERNVIRKSGSRTIHVNRLNAKVIQFENDIVSIENSGMIGTTKREQYLLSYIFELRHQLTALLNDRENGTSNLVFEYNPVMTERKATSEVERLKRDLNQSADHGLTSKEYETCAFKDFEKLELTSKNQHADSQTFRYDQKHVKLSMQQSTSSNVQLNNSLERISGYPRQIEDRDKFRYEEENCTVSTENEMSKSNVKVILKKSIGKSVQKIAPTFFCFVSMHDQRHSIAADNIVPGSSASRTPLHHSASHVIDKNSVQLLECMSPSLQNRNLQEKVPFGSVEVRKNIHNKTKDDIGKLQYSTFTQYHNDSVTDVDSSRLLSVFISESVSQQPTFNEGNDSASTLNKKIMFDGQRNGVKISPVTENFRPVSETEITPKSNYTKRMTNNVSATVPQLNLQNLVTSSSITITPLKKNDSNQLQLDESVSLHENKGTLHTEESSNSTYLGNKEMNDDQKISPALSQHTSRRVVGLDNSNGSESASKNATTPFLRLQNEKEMLYHSGKTTTKESSIKVDRITSHFPSNEEAIINACLFKSTDTESVLKNDFIKYQLEKAIEKNELMKKKLEDANKDMKVMADKIFVLNNERLERLSRIDELENALSKSKDRESMLITKNVTVEDSNERFRKIASSLSIKVMQNKMRGKKAMEASQMQMNEIKKLRAKLIEKELSLGEARADLKTISDKYASVQGEMTSILNENVSLEDKLNPYRGSPTCDTIVLDSEGSVETIDCAVYGSAYHQNLLTSIPLNILKYRIATLAATLVKLKIREKNIWKEKDRVVRKYDLLQQEFNQAKDILTRERNACILGGRLKSKENVFHDLYPHVEKCKDEEVQIETFSRSLIELFQSYKQGKEESASVITKLKLENDSLIDRIACLQHEQEDESKTGEKLLIITSKNDTLESITELRQDMSRAIKKLKAQITSLQAKNKSMTAKIQDLKKTNQHLSENLTLSDAQANTFKKIIQELETRVSEKNIETEALKGIIRCQNDRMDELCSLIQNLAEKKDAVEGNLSIRSNSAIMTTIHRRPSSSSTTPINLGDYQSDDKTPCLYADDSHPLADRLDTHHSDKHLQTVNEDTFKFASIREIVKTANYAHISENEINNDCDKMIKVHSINPLFEEDRKSQDVKHRRSILNPVHSESQIVKDDFVEENNQPPSMRHQIILMNSLTKQSQMGADLAKDNDDMKVRGKKSSKPETTHVDLSEQRRISTRTFDVKSRNDLHQSAVVSGNEMSGTPKTEKDPEAQELLVDQLVMKGEFKEKSSQTLGKTTKNVRISRAPNKVRSILRYEIKKGQSMLDVFKDAKRSGRKDGIRYREGKNEVITIVTEPISPGEKRKRLQHELMLKSLRRRYDA